MVSGFAKNFNLSFEEVLHQVSYTNLILYSRTLPSYDFNPEKETSKEKKISPKDFFTELKKMRQ